MLLQQTTCLNIEVKHKCQFCAGTGQPTLKAAESFILDCLCLSAASVTECLFSQGVFMIDSMLSFRARLCSQQLPLQIVHHLRKMSIKEAQPSAHNRSLSKEAAMMMLHSSVLCIQKGAVCRMHAYPSYTYPHQKSKLWDWGGMFREAICWQEPAQHTTKKQN